MCTWQHVRWHYKPYVTSETLGMTSVTIFFLGHYGTGLMNTDFHDDTSIATKLWFSYQGSCSTVLTSFFEFWETTFFWCILGTYCKVKEHFTNKIILFKIYKQVLHNFNVYICLADIYILCTCTYKLVTGKLSSGYSFMIFYKHH